MTITTSSDVRDTSFPPIEHGAVAVLVPAHNEAAQIKATIESLLAQSRVPHIVVICDNCTDDTYVIAAGFPGVTVLETAGNRYKKAGALNRGIEYLLHQEKFPEFVVTIDADTILDQYFIERAVRHLHSDGKLGGLSAVCRGKRSLTEWPLPQPEPDKIGHHGRPSWPKRAQYSLTHPTAFLRAATSATLYWFQMAEYARAGELRLRTNIHTMAGAGSIMRTQAIFDVLESRPNLYAERPDNLVEDYELTLEMKRWGWRCTNNYHCIAHTDLMPTLPILLRQRIRWVRGTITELRRRGWRPETRASILTIAYGYLSLPLYWLLNGFFFYRLTQSGGAQHWLTWLCAAVLSLFQAFVLRTIGVRAILIGALLIPEQLYGLVRHTWLVMSLVKSFRRTDQSWE